MVNSYQLPITNYLLCYSTRNSLVLQESKAGDQDIWISANQEIRWPDNLVAHPALRGPEPFLTEGKVLSDAETTPAFTGRSSGPRLAGILSHIIWKSAIFL